MYLLIISLQLFLFIIQPNKLQLVELIVEESDWTVWEVIVREVINSQRFTLLHRMSVCCLYSSHTIAIHNKEMPKIKLWLGAHSNWCYNRGKEMRNSQNQNTRVVLPLLFYNVRVQQWYNVLSLKHDLKLFFYHASDDLWLRLTKSYT